MEEVRIRVISQDRPLFSRTPRSHQEILNDVDFEKKSKYVLPPFYFRTQIR